MAVVDAAEFKRIAPQITDARRAQILPPLQRAMRRFNIDESKPREAHFMAQVLNESGGF
jgi:predicted chitinase